MKLSKGILINLVTLAAVFTVCPCCKAQMALSSSGVKSLSQAYESYFPIGTAINPLRDLSDPEIMDWIGENYNSITPENHLKPKYIQPEEGVWKWETADKTIAFAVAHDMKVRGHALVWFQSTPEWMVMDEDKPASKKLLLERLELHITTVMNRYKGMIDCWDVVNEAISNNETELFREKQDLLYQILGEDYVAEAFKIAHKVDPTAKLIYNDYRFSNPQKREKIYNLLEGLLEEGVPIDGVGMQFHLVPDEITEEYFQETIDMFSSLGLEVQLTELEVSVYNYRKKGHTDLDENDDQYSQERMQKQADMYEMIFRTLRKNSSKIGSVTFWGSRDVVKNFRTIQLKKMDYPYLFDVQMKPKPFYPRIVNF